MFCTFAPPMDHLVPADCTCVWFLAGRGLIRYRGVQEEHHGFVRRRETVPHWAGDRPLPGLRTVTSLPGILQSPSPLRLRLPTSWCNLVHVWPLTSLHHLEWRQKVYRWTCCFSFEPLRGLFFCFWTLRSPWDSRSNDYRSILWFYLFDF